MHGLLAMLAAIVAMVFCIVLAEFAPRPSTARCPDGTYVEGVRPDGSTTCVTRPPRGCDEPAGTAAEQRPCVFRERRVPERGVHCTGGSRPIVVDKRTVGCTRGP